MATSFCKTNVLKRFGLLPVSRSRYNTYFGLRQLRKLSTTNDKTDLDLYDAEYPAVIPKFPPGEWGNMDRKHAWMWTSFKDELMNIPNAIERMKIFLQNETDAVVLQQINDHPASLGFRKYATKTVSHPWNNETLSQFYHTDSDLVDKMVNELKTSLTDHFLMEHETVLREETKSTVLQDKRCKRIVQCISETFLSQMSKDFVHLQQSQLVENAVSRVLWDCYGIGREENDEEVSYSNIDDIVAIIEKNDEKIHSEVVFDLILRSHLPLPEVESIQSSLSTDRSNSPKLEYKLNSYGHKHHTNQKLNDIFAGHKAGDPCEFGLLGFLNTCGTHYIEGTLNARVARECRQAMGITGAFTWLAAQAYNQGFNPAIELTYPLTSQVVLTDGQHFSFLLYQLNTLALWRQASDRNNLCWQTQEMPLYHSVEDGVVKELNEDVLRLLTQMFLVRPVDRGYDMKPTLTDKDPKLHLKADFIPEKVIVEEVIEEEKYIV